MKIHIHELAAREFDEAIEWYELQSEGLGERFKEATSRQIEKITRNPRWFLIEVDDIYKAYVPKFPYKILYTVEEESIVVWAISQRTEGMGRGQRLEVR